MPIKQKFVCQNCGNERIGINSTGTYCNNRCQQEHAATKRINEWLQTGVGSTHAGAKWLREYLLTQQEHRCDICKNPDVWQNHKLVFVLDHINGDSSNSSRENLRLICPNCDSQTSTFKGRNRGHGRHTRKLRYANNQSY